MLFRQDSPDQAHDSIPIWEDPNNIGTPADLPMKPFGGVISPHRLWALGERQQFI